MKLLLIRFSSLGDVILLSSVFEGLGKHQVSFDILTDENNTEIFKWDRRVNRIIGISDYSIRNLKRIARDINNNNYDYIFDLHKVNKSFILTKFLKAKVIKYRKRSVLRRLSIVFKSIKSKWLFVPDMYAEPFQRIGIKIENPLPKIHIPEHVKERVKEILPKTHFAVLSPGAKWEGKRYPVKKFKEIASLLKERGIQSVIVGGKEDYELGEFIRKGNEAIINLSGKLSILESMAAISFAEFAISNDSAVVHMARAVKTKVVSIFGPTHPFFGFAPGKDEGIAITLNLPCSPCSLHGKRVCKDQKCFEIEPSFIVDRALSLIKS